MGFAAFRAMLGQPFTIVTINTNQNNYNLATDLSNNYGWDGSSPINVVAVNNATIGSTGVSTPAFTIPSSITGTVKLVNRGIIQGAGGSAGSAGAAGGGNGGTAGSGGDALSVGASGVILDNGSGIVRSGGGGGGGGAGVSAGRFSQAETPVCESDAAAGGAGGLGEGSNQSRSNGSSGTTTSAGVCTMTGGSGGNGGNFGSAGSNGNGPSVGASCDCGISQGSGGSGGAAGFSIDGYSNVTVVSTGTITGPTNG